jgi:hypothetical protein
MFRSKFASDEAWELWHCPHSPALTECRPRGVSTVIGRSNRSSTTKIFKGRKNRHRKNAAMKIARKIMAVFFNMAAFPNVE